jgi:choice-of-anchor B domain-containing protein
MGFATFVSMKKLLLVAIMAGLTLSTTAQTSHNMDSLFHWKDTTLLGSWFFNNAYNEVWGMVVDSKEYAVIGSTAGTHIFDVTIPDSSYLAAFVPGAQTGGIIIHRDYHDYNGYLYAVADEGISTLQIIDISTLPDSVSVVYDSDNLFVRAHNIFIDTATAKMYACATKDSASNYPMNIYSLADPTNPTFLYTYPDVGHVHDVYVRNDTAYCNNGPDALTVVDFTSGSSHTTLGTLTSYPHQGYNHSGWLSEDGQIYVFADENHGLDIKICDVSDLSNITVLSQINSNVHVDSSMAHNLIIKNDTLYVSYYHDGVRLYDISDPANPFEIAWYDTYLETDHQSYRGAWGVYPFLPSGNVLVSDMQSGLFVLGISDSAVILPPVADFSTAISGLQVSFLDLSTNTPTSWAWDFGDGTTDTVQHPSHTYSTDSTYWVCLTAGNAGGSDMYCDSVTVTEPPSFIANKQHQVLVYPVPAIDRLMVALPGMKQLVIYDLIGNKHLSRVVNQDHVALDISHLPAGTFLLQVHTHDALITRKLTKLK